MAITLDSTSSKKSDNVSSDTISHTCTGTEQDGRLIVGISVWGGSADVSNFTADYAGNSMELIEFIEESDTGLVAIAVFELKNPPEGTANITITTNTGSRYFRTIASSWKGVAEQAINTINKKYEGFSSANEPNVDITTPVDNCIVIDFASRSIDNNTWSVGSNQTIINQGQVGTGFETHMASSYESVSTASTTTMNWSGTDGTGNWGSIAVCLYPAGERLIIKNINKIITS